jgi:hypothetical protein
MSTSRKTVERKVMIQTRPSVREIRQYFLTSTTYGVKYLRAYIESYLTYINGSKLNLGPLVYSKFVEYHPLLEQNNVIHVEALSVN